MSSYVFRLKSDVIGRTQLKFKNPKDLKVDDIIYISNDNIVKTRWKVSKIKGNVMILKKDPYISVNVPFEKAFSQKYNEKINLISSDDEKNISNYFLHKVKIYPCYDYESKNNITNMILDKIRKNDLDAEIYIDVFTDNTNFTFKNCFKDTYNLLISKKKGIIIFKSISKEQFSDNNFLNDFFEDLGSKDMIFNSLLGSSLLTDDGEKLNIPYSRYYVSNDDLDDEFYSKVNDIFKEKYSGKIKLLGLSEFVKTISETDGIDVLNENIHFGIMQMLMPQYITSRVECLPKGKLKFIDSNCYELDENQRMVLNALNERTYIKASAGSGKTIILLSKAYQMATNNPDKQFLIICYNNKLSEDISKLAENTGKQRSNLKIFTLDKFIEEENISTYRCEDENEMFRIRKKQFVERIEAGKYTKKYGGIFIDEMQQLNDDWKLSLLNCCDDNHYMIMAGDFFQKIRLEAAEELSDMDDELIDEDDESGYTLGDYNFKQIVFDINYRNTKEISTVVNKMIRKIEFYREKLELPIKKEEKTIICGKALKSSVIMPKYIKVDSKEKETNSIKANIEYLINEKGYIQRDILVVSPFGNTKKYPWLYGLKQELIDMGLQVCEFSNNSLSAEGIRFGTIGKAIGLDFKAVIICGLEQLVKLIDKDDYKFEKLNDLINQDNDIKNAFIKNLKNIYVACSRARETLIVIDDIKQPNLITEFVKIVGEENE